MSREVKRSGTRTSSQKLMPLEELRNSGYLQEVNRQFFHPLGLALGLEADANGTILRAFVIDNRDDPEGMYFDSLTAEEVDRGRRIAADRELRLHARWSALGYIVQPLEVTR